jgi:hypothetical protein
MDAEQAFGIMRRLLSDYYRRGEPLSDALVRRGADFHDWFLRYAVMRMLLQNEGCIAGYSRTQVGRVDSLYVSSYSEEPWQGRTIVRMEFTARTGFVTRFRLTAELESGGCWVRIDMGHRTGRAFHGVVNGDGSVSSDESARPQSAPARQHAVTHRHHRAP